MRLGISGFLPRTLDELDVAAIQRVWVFGFTGTISGARNPDQNPWVAEHQHFVDCCLEDKPVISDGHFGRKVPAIRMAGYQTGREGRVVGLSAAPEVAP